MNILTIIFIFSIFPWILGCQSNFEEIDYVFECTKFSAGTSLAIRDVHFRPGTNVLTGEFIDRLGRKERKFEIFNGFGSRPTSNPTLPAISIGDGYSDIHWYKNAPEIIVARPGVVGTSIEKIDPQSRSVTRLLDGKFEYEDIEFYFIERHFLYLGVRRDDFVDLMSIGLANGVKRPRLLTTIKSPNEISTSEDAMARSSLYWFEKSGPYHENFVASGASMALSRISLMPPVPDILDFLRSDETLDLVFQSGEFDDDRSVIKHIRKKKGIGHQLETSYSLRDFQTDNIKVFSLDDGLGIVASVWKHNHHRLIFFKSNGHKIVRLKSFGPFRNGLGLKKLFHTKDRKIGMLLSQKKKFGHDLWGCLVPIE